MWSSDCGTAQVKVTRACFGLMAIRWWLDEEVHLPTFFPIKAFSQGEVIEYARALGVSRSSTTSLIFQAERSALKARSRSSEKTQPP